jgi:peptidoglycan/xylan/chitin deacetylase (PgdA/CDA1 family)
VAGSLARSVELTFDDGPHPVWTRAILAALRGSPLRATLGVLASLGIRPRRWRTPSGLRAPWTHEIATAHGLELCGWDIDSHDRRGHRAERMLADAGPALHPGAVVRLHDGVGPGALRDGCDETVRFARLLAAEAAAA